MKKLVIAIACLFIAACGSESQSDKASGTNIFSQPVKIAGSLVVGTMEASNLTIIGLSRTPDTATLTITADINNSDTENKNVTITISGKDKNQVEIVTTDIKSIVNAGEKVSVSSTSNADPVALFQVEYWSIKSITTTSLPPVMGNLSTVSTPVQ